ncbi:Lys63-specific deubiquitinase [Aureococcus anophagefferens]|nr:Lys63-specific deubiquitinase [Aureococcus anophagefferens]
MAPALAPEGHAKAPPQKTKAEAADIALESARGKIAAFSRDGDAEIALLAERPRTRRLSAAGAEEILLMASAEAEPAHLFQVLRCKKLAQASCYVVVTHGDDEIGRTPTVKAAADPSSAPVRRRKPTPQAAPEKAPSMRRLTCGPGLDGGLGLGLFARLEEAVVSMMDRAVAPVTLHVYDVGRSVHTGRINSFGAATLAGRRFPRRDRVYGKEFTFAGSNKAMPGIFSSNPRKCPFHTYRESIYLGTAA